MPKKPKAILEADYEALKRHHEFIPSSQEAGWEGRLVSKYNEKLYREFCLADLSKAPRIALRWRTEEEVQSGKGHFICANLSCFAFKNLDAYEMNFGYLEGGEKKNALVKVMLCTDCSLLVGAMENWDLLESLVTPQEVLECDDIGSILELKRLELYSSLLSYLEATKAKLDSLGHSISTLSDSSKELEKRALEMLHENEFLVEHSKELEAKKRMTDMEESLKRKYIIDDSEKNLLESDVLGSAFFQVVDKISEGLTICDDLQPAESIAAELKDLKEKAQQKISLCLDSFIQSCKMQNHPEVHRHVIKSIKYLAGTGQPFKYASILMKRNFIENYCESRSAFLNKHFEACIESDSLDLFTDLLAWLHQQLACELEALSMLGLEAREGVLSVIFDSTLSKIFHSHVQCIEKESSLDGLLRKAEVIIFYKRLFQRLLQSALFEEFLKNVLSKLHTILAVKFNSFASEIIATPEMPLGDLQPTKNILKLCRLIKSFKELQSEEEAFSDVLSSALSSFQQVCMLSSQRVGGESSRNIFILNCHLKCKACLSSQSESDDLILSLVTAITDSVVQDQFWSLIDFLQLKETFIQLGVEEEDSVDFEKLKEVFEVISHKMASSKYDYKELRLLSDPTCRSSIQKRVTMLFLRFYNTLLQLIGQDSATQRLSFNIPLSKDVGEWLSS